MDSLFNIYAKIIICFRKITLKLKSLINIFFSVTQNSNDILKKKR